jgi:RNA-directed DNA polymerase
VQRIVVEYLSGIVAPDQSATAYVSGASIAKNAMQHAGAKYLLKLDFSDFFGSIKQSDIVSFLRGATEDQASEVELRLMSRALCWEAVTGADLSLCIGAPSSPFICNVIMRSFDRDLREKADEFGVRYTRYSDDMAFSGMSVDAIVSIERFVRHVCHSHMTPRLRLNDEKRVLVSRSSSMSVTGLRLSTQGGITVGRKRKRAIRAGVNGYLHGKLSVKQIEKLHGEIAFASDVEKDFLDQLHRWYGAEIGRLLRKKTP